MIIVEIIFIFIKFMKSDEFILLSPPCLTGAEIDYIKQALKSGWITTLGPQVEAFEEAMCKYTGYPYALATSSGSASLHLALKVLGVQKNDYVWSPSLTFIGGVSAINFCGALPVFFDSDPDSWTISLKLLETTLKKKAFFPKTIIATDIYGLPCPYKELEDLSKAYAIPLIIDAAESLGATDKEGKRNKPSLLFYSFNGNKIITTSGGGMLLSHNKELIDYARFLATQARPQLPYYHHEEIGFNYRMSNILAAIGLAQLESIEQRIDNKKKIFQYYKSGLGDIPGISFMPIPKKGSPNYWLTVLCITPDTGITPLALQDYLSKQHIETRCAWKPMHLQPVFKNATMIGGEICETIFQTGLCLPSGSDLTQLQQDRVIEKIISFFEKS